MPYKLLAIDQRFTNSATSYSNVSDSLLVPSLILSPPLAGRFDNGTELSSGYFDKISSGEMTTPSVLPVFTAPGCWRGGHLDFRQERTKMRLRPTAIGTSVISSTVSGSAQMNAPEGDMILTFLANTVSLWPLWHLLNPKVRYARTIYAGMPDCMRLFDALCSNVSFRGAQID